MPMTVIAHFPILYSYLFKKDGTPNGNHGETASLKKIWQ
jgi:hypothetical protein